MREIAHTAFGRNILVAGLICHLAAILAGMMTASGADFFFKIVYPFSWLLLIAGAFAEIRQRGGRPLNTWRFYIAVMAAVFPVLGPLIVLALIYSFPEGGTDGQGNLSGLFPAIFRLRANILVIFLLMVLLLVLFVFTNSQDDPYYKKRYRNYQNRQVVTQSDTPAGQHEKAIRIIKMFSRDNQRGKYFVEKVSARAHGFIN